MKKYAENVRTMQDVQNVPEDQFIPMMNWKNFTCPFCGTPLNSEIVGFGRDKCRQYHSCGCEVAQAAEAHNKRQEELEHLAWLKEQEEAAKEEAKRREEEKKKPVTITAEQMFCVITGRILPGVEPVPADDAVGAAMRHVGFDEGSSKENLKAYAEQQGFAHALERAANELVELITRPGLRERGLINWKTDISGKVTQLCEDYRIPRSLTL